MDTTGRGTGAQEARESWSNPRKVGTGPSRPGELVEHAVPQTLAQVARDSLSTPGDVA